MPQAYAPEKPKTVIKEVAARTVRQSEYPFRVQSYQFKSLDDARKFSLDLAASPKSGHKHKVEMLHRALEIHAKDGAEDKAPTVHSIVLDVTHMEPDQAEAGWKP